MSKITTLDEFNEFPPTPHYLWGIGNSQPASFVFLSMVFAGFRTIPAMDVVKIKQLIFIPYKIVPKKWMIAYLLDWAHKSIKSHLKTREILFNFKRKNIVEQVIMNTENSRKAFLQEIDFEVGDSALLTSWITELLNIRIRSFKKEKPMKDTKEERDKKLIASKQK